MHPSPSSPLTPAAQGESVFLRVDESFSSIFDGRCARLHHACALKPPFARLILHALFFVANPVVFVVDCFKSEGGDTGSGAPTMRRRCGRGGQQDLEPLVMVPEAAVITRRTGGGE